MEEKKCPSCHTKVYGWDCWGYCSLCGSDRDSSGAHLCKPDGRKYCQICGSEEVIKETKIDKCLYCGCTDGPVEPSEIWGPGCTGWPVCPECHSV